MRLSLPGPGLSLLMNLRPVLRTAGKKTVLWRKLTKPYLCIQTLGWPRGTVSYHGHHFLLHTGSHPEDGMRERGPGASCRPRRRPEPVAKEQKEMALTEASVSNYSGRPRHSGRCIFFHDVRKKFKCDPTDPPIRFPLRVTSITWVPSRLTPQAPPRVPPPGGP